MLLRDPIHNLLYDPRLQEQSFPKIREKFYLLDTLSECKGIDYILSTEFASIDESEQREYFEHVFRKENNLEESITFDRIRPIIDNNKLLLRKNIESRIINLIEDLKQRQDPDTGGWKLISKNDLVKEYPLRSDEIQNQKNPYFSNGWAVATCIRALIKWRAYMNDISVDSHIEKGLKWLRINKVKEWHGTILEGLDSLPAELNPNTIKIYDTSYAILAFLYAPDEARVDIRSVPYIDTVVTYFNSDKKCWLIKGEEDVGATSYSLYTLLRYYKKYKRSESTSVPAHKLSNIEQLILQGAGWLLQNRIRGAWGVGSALFAKEPSVEKTCLATNALIKYCESFDCDQAYYDAVEDAVQYVSRNLFFTYEGPKKGWAWLDKENNPDVFTTTLALNMLFKYAGHANLTEIKQGTIWLLNQWETDGNKNSDISSGTHPMDKAYILCSVLDYLYSKYRRGLPDLILTQET